MNPSTNFGGCATVTFSNLVSFPLAGGCNITGATDTTTKFNNMTRLRLSIRSLFWLALVDLARFSAVAWKGKSLEGTAPNRRGSRRVVRTLKGKKSGKGDGTEDAYPVDSGSYDEEENIFDNGSRGTISTENNFIAYCRSQLITYGAASDGLISQSDAAIFIQEVCDIMDDEDLPSFHCPTPEFANLEIEIQLSFVWYICPHDDQVSLLNCLSNLGVKGGDFGYSISAETYQEAADNVLGFCCSLLPFLEETGIDPLSGESTLVSPDIY
jgi:hypothetical protein